MRSIFVLPYPVDTSSIKNDIDWTRLTSPAHDPSSLSIAWGWELLWTGQDVEAGDDPILLPRHWRQGFPEDREGWPLAVIYRLND